MTIESYADRIAAVGVLVIEWSRVELACDMVLSALNDPPLSDALLQAIAASVSIEQRIQIIRDIAKSSQVIDDAQRTALTKLLDVTSHRRRERNDMVHAYYPDDEMIIRLGKNAPPRHFTVADIRAVADRVRSLVSDLDRFLAHELPALL
jgi:hypothetical protein